jgi:hypothetical protein
MFATFTSSMDARNKDADTTPVPPTRTRRNVAARACDRCRLSRIKCDDGQPCKSCRSKGVDCSKGKPGERTDRSVLFVFCVSLSPSAPLCRHNSEIVGGRLVTWDLECVVAGAAWTRSRNEG